MLPSICLHHGCQESLQSSGALSASCPSLSNKHFEIQKQQTPRWLPLSTASQLAYLGIEQARQPHRVGCGDAASCPIVQLVIPLQDVLHHGNSTMNMPMRLINLSCMPCLRRRTVVRQSSCVAYHVPQRECEHFLIPC